MSTETSVFDSTYRKWRERKSADTRPVAALIQAALAEQDEDRYWEIVGVMQARADRESLDAALQLCRSGSAQERCVGVNILSQMGGEVKAFPEVVEPIPFELLATDNHCEVLGATCYAVGHRYVAAAVPLLARLSTHPLAEVRYAVVHGLLAQEAQEAVDSLIRLTGDEDEDVRNWATFGLAQQITLDTPAIRSALRARLSDEACEVRGEALVGLVSRDAPDSVELVRAELGRDVVHGEAFEAAALVADASLVPLLREWRDCWEADDSRLTRAIALCEGRGDPDED